MDKLTDWLTLTLMLGTVHEIFAGMIMSAFMTIIEFHQQNIRGEISDQPRDKQYERLEFIVCIIKKLTISSRFCSWNV